MTVSRTSSTVLMGLITSHLHKPHVAMPSELDIPPFPQRIEVSRLEWHPQPTLQLSERALRLTDEMKVSEQPPLDDIDTQACVQDVEGGWRQVTPHLWQADM